MSDTSLLPPHQFTLCFSGSFNCCMCHWNTSLCIKYNNVRMSWLLFWFLGWLLQLLVKCHVFYKYNSILVVVYRCVMVVELFCVTICPTSTLWMGERNPLLPFRCQCSITTATKTKDILLPDGWQHPHWQPLPVQQIPHQHHSANSTSKWNAFPTSVLRMAIIWINEF